MQTKNTISSKYSVENGGRSLVLLLLFFVALLSFKSSGFTSFAAVCCAPLVILFGYFFFRIKMSLFYTLFIVNTLLMFAQRHYSIPVPISMINEMMEIMLIAMALIEVANYKITNLLNVMGATLLVWLAFCTLELLNDSCDIGIDVYRWYTGARLMSMQLVYAFIVYTLFVNTPEKLMRVFVLWACFILFASFWVWKQINIGMTDAEKSFLYSSPSHIVAGKIRYFSCFTDAANFGIHTAVASAVFIILAITLKIKRYRYFFLAVGLIGIWAFFQSGTRTAIFCLIAVFLVYIVLSKSVKLMLYFGGLMLVALYILIFTTIGDSNYSIRRMRTAFDTEDASMNVRDMNKATLRKYMAEVPWGVGIGLENSDIPPFNKFRLITQVPPDSEYVYIWVRTGKIGLTVFIITTLILAFGASWVVMFRLKNKTLIGIGAAYTGAFIGMHLGGYANQILMQFPNILIYYGGLAIVYCLPKMEGAWAEWEAKQLARQEERRRLKLEKKRASRV